jgi:hypothetical protein
MSLNLKFKGCLKLLLLKQRALYIVEPFVEPKIASLYRV